MLQRMFKVGLAVLVLFTPSCAAMLEEMMAAPREIATQQELDDGIERLRSGGTEPEYPKFNLLSVHTVAGDMKAAPVARDFEALCTLVTLLGKRDFETLKNVEARGDVFSLDKGTEIMAYRPQGPKRWVRVLNGEHKGKQGWTLFDFLGEPLRWEPLDPNKDIAFKDKQ